MADRIDSLQITIRPDFLDSTHRLMKFSVVVNGEEYHFEHVLRQGDLMIFLSITSFLDDIFEYAKKTLKAEIKKQANNERVSRK